MDQTAARSSTRRPVVFRDGLGRRCRVPDQSGNEKLEILCLRSELTVSEQFEPALRERVTRLASFHSPEFSRLKTVERLRDQTSTLVLVSETTPGVRLSDLVATAERRGFGLEGTAAWGLVRQLVRAIATLHEEAADVAHGAISTERIVITPDARLVVVEFALASALKHVRLSHEQFWKELRVACPRAASVAPLDHRSDITQIGVVALSLLLGRSLRDDEYPSQMSRLVELAATLTADDAPMSDELRSWLQRALQLKGRESFASAIEASARLDEALEQSHYTLDAADVTTFVARCQDPDEPVRAASVPAEPAPVDSPVSTPASAPSPLAAPENVVRAIVAHKPEARTPVNEPAAAPVAASETPKITSGPRLVPAPVSSASNTVLQLPAGLTTAPAATLPAVTLDKATTTEMSTPPTSDLGGIFASTTVVAKDNTRWRRTAAAAALLTVISGAGWAAASHYFDVSAEPGASSPIASTATTAPAQFASMAAPSVAPALGADASKPAVEPTPAPTALDITSMPAAAAVVPPAAPPSGWVSVTASADVQVFENGALLGTSQGGRVALPPGAHQIELVSETIGFRSSRSVQVKSNETAAIKVDFPNGTIALNATPWAEVIIDGRNVGETPIGNLAIAAGSHEVVFRHPELGEQRTVATVTLTAPTRLSVDMRKR